jgi:hypothetical protein
MALLPAANKKTQAIDVFVPNGPDTNKTENSSAASQMGQAKENSNQKSLIEWLIELLRRTLGSFRG